MEGQAEEDQGEVSEMKQDVFNLEWVAPEQVTEDDWHWLRAAEFAGPSFDRVTELAITYALKQGTMHLFRMRPNPGVVLVEVVVNSHHMKRLNIIRAGGQKVGWSLPGIARLLKRTAQDWGCDAIYTDVYSQRVAETLMRVGAKVESVRVVMEVDDGQ